VKAPPKCEDHKKSSGSWKRYRKENCSRPWKTLKSLKKDLEVIQTADLRISEEEEVEGAERTHLGMSLMAATRSARNQIKSFATKLVRLQ